MIKEKKYEEALYDILNANRIDVAKEIAADVLGIDVDEYLADLSDLDFESLEDDDFYDELRFEEID